MKILLVAYACEPNKGSEPGVGWNWAIHLTKYADVTVLTRTNNRAQIEAALSQYEANNVKFIYYDLPYLASLKKKLPVALKLYYLCWVIGVKNFIRRNIPIANVDIVHFITFNTFLIPPPIYGLGARSIWGPVGGGIFGHLESFRKMSFRSYLTELARSKLIKLCAHSTLYRKGLTKYDKVIFSNTETGRLLGEESRLVQLETGISRMGIHSAEPGRSSPKEYLNLLFCGAFVPRKGLHLLLVALKDIKCKVDLTVIGDGRWRAKLIRMTRQLGLQNVHFLGFIPHEQIMGYYDQADVFVFPSIRDTSGNVVLEAMSQGLPIIAFDHHGVHDILTNACAIKIAVTSYIDMVTNLRKAIEYLANNPSIRTEMGQCSRQRIAEQFLWEDKARRMIEIYKRVLNEGFANS
jgi:glycosyltransferase involved in cell wall biosynthesis